MTDTFTVGLICRNLLFRDLLARAVEERGNVVAAQDAGLGAFLRAVVEQPLDLVVLERNPGEVRTLAQDLARLRDVHPGARIAVLVQPDDLETQIASVRSDVEGVIRKDVSRQSFLETLALMASGELAYPAFLLRKVLADSGPADDQGTPAGAGADDPLAGFSNQEKEVLFLLMDGNTNKEIGRRMGIAESTVKGHVRRICRRTGSENRTQVAMWARRHLDDCGGSPRAESGPSRRGMSGPMGASAASLTGRANL